MRILSSFSNPRFIGLAGKSYKTFVVDINSPRIHRGYANINAHIEFQAIYQERVVHVPTDNTVLVYGHFGNIVDLKVVSKRTNNLQCKCLYLKMNFEAWWSTCSFPPWILDCESASRSQQIRLVKCTCPELYWTLPFQISLAFSLYLRTIDLCVWVHLN